MSDKIATLRFGIVIRPVVLYADRIEYKGASYPLAGAHAEVAETRSGLVGRKHTTDVTITTTAGQFVWSATGAGTNARIAHRAATRFAAALNTAAMGATSDA